MRLSVHREALPDRPIADVDVDASVSPITRASRPVSFQARSVLAPSLLKRGIKRSAGGCGRLMTWIRRSRSRLLDSSFPSFDQLQVLFPRLFMHTE